MNNASAEKTSASTDAARPGRAQARRVPALSARRLRRVGVAGAVAHLYRALQYRRAGMARAGHARPVRRDDRQGDRHSQPHAQDQGVARGGAARTAQAVDAARQPRRSARGVSLADAGGTTRSTTKPRRSRSTSPASSQRSSIPPTAPPSTAALQRLTERSAQLDSRTRQGPGRRARLPPSLLPARDASP